MRFIVSLLILSVSTGVHAEVDPKTLITQAMDHWRGVTSYTEMTMEIRRPDWHRVMSMKAWTRGSEHSLVRVTAPAKDAGNGTLSMDSNMWTYAPKINRVIKVPSSMMSQSWMGSDMSNKDISKSTDIIDNYDHTLVETRERNGHTVYVVESIPHEEAAVVWGKEVTIIRDDYVLLEQQFWDQDTLLVKTLTTTEVKALGGREVATVMRMHEVDKPGQWTEMRVDQIEFNVDLPANLFTLSSLRNPRR